MDDEVRFALIRIESKLDALIASLADDYEELVDRSTLDGEQMLVREREAGTPL